MFKWFIWLGVFGLNVVWFAILRHKYQRFMKGDANSEK
jgi:hypothetical protein